MVWGLKGSRRAPRPAAQYPTPYQLPGFRDQGDRSETPFRCEDEVVKHTRGRIVTVTSVEELDARLADTSTRLTGWRIVGVDLRERSGRLRERDTSRTTFAGCVFAPDDAALHAARGALVLPDVSTTPVDIRRQSLYTAAELFDAHHYEDSVDARAYSWQNRRREPDDLLARALHDEAIDSALSDWTAERRIAGVMGGHSLARGDAGYAEAAGLGRLLATGQRDGGITVATGGGPGAMEAANLGARLARHPESALDDALRELARVPSFHPSVDAWLEPALEIVATLPDPVDSLGIPTWHYGHEPPSPFPTAIAKYFRNALRESILLEIADAGIVFLPGAAGTVQEIFQDACENYYATDDAIAPMVLVGREYWTQTLPAWPLLRALARGRAMEPHVHLVDTVGEAAALLT